MYILKQRKDYVIDESKVMNKSNLRFIVVTQTQRLKKTAETRLNSQLADKRKQKIIELREKLRMKKNRNE